MAGYYSIVQYMPRPDRQEGVNFGIMLLEKETGQFRWILTRPIRKIRRLFSGLSDVMVNDLVTSFYNRICTERITNLDEFTSFVLTRGGAVQCTEPIWIDFPEGYLEVIIHKLLEQLVL